MSEQIATISDCQRIVKNRGVDYICKLNCNQCIFGIPKVMKELRQAGITDTVKSDNGATFYPIMLNDQGEIRAMIPVKYGIITWDHIIHGGVVEPKMRTLVNFQTYGEAGNAWA